MPPALKATTPVQFRLHNALLRELRRIAKREGLSVAEQLRRATSDYLDRRMGGAA
jgi:hypothetical protein